MNAGSIHQRSLCPYLDVVISAGALCGPLQLEGAECELHHLVDRRGDMPQAVQPRLVLPIQVDVWRAKGARRVGQVAAAALLGSWKGDEGGQERCEGFRSNHKRETNISYMQFTPAVHS